MGMMHLSLISSTIGQARLGSGLYLHLHRWRWSCGRYADDTCFTRAFVNAPTAVVGSHSKLPSSVIILINGWLSSLGSRVCTSILNPAVLAPHKLSPPLSHVSSSCSHVPKSYKPRSSRKTWGKNRTSSKILLVCTRKYQHCTYHKGPPAAGGGGNLIRLSNHNFFTQGLQSCIHKLSIDAMI